MEAISTTRILQTKISGLRTIKKGLLLAAAISGTIMGVNLTKNIKNNNNMNQEKATTEVVTEDKNQNSTHLPYVSGTLFTLGLLGALGANSAGKKAEKELDELDENEAKVLNLPVDVYQAIKYVPEIKQVGFTNPYENTLSMRLFNYPAKIAPKIEQVIDFWKEKYNLNIIKEDKEAELRELLNEAKNHQNGMSEVVEAFNNRKFKHDDVFPEKLTDTFRDSLKYPGINYRGFSYLDTGKVNTDKVLINGWA